MPKDPFDLYKLPAGLTDSVAIPLGGTPSVFHVKLPATSNEDFSMSLIARLNTQMGDDGEMRVDALRFQVERRDLFFETCVVKADGLPGNMTISEFFDTYPLAKRAVWERAMELASVVDDEVQEAMGKSASLPNGKSSGKDDTNSMNNSSNKGSKSKHGGPILAA